MPDVNPPPDKNDVTVSFEIFPPKNETGADKLWTSLRQLSRLQPQFISVTCGAGGSAIDGTGAVVRHIHQQFKLPIAPHIAIARQSRSRVRAALEEYKKIGIRRIVAIRGDPTLTPGDIKPDDIYPNTVDFVRELKSEFGLDPIVAAYPDVHPNAQSPQQDLDHLKRKADAGAVLAISQFFFLPETFLRFRDRIVAAGIKVPLVPGIMPIHNLAQTVKFAEGCGTIVPDKLGQRFERHGDNPDALFQEAVAHAAALCEKLREESVDHFHFYMLNRSELTAAICEKLSIRSKA